MACALKLEDGRITQARLALGGVAHKPWRDEAAEASLVGQAPSPEAFAVVAEQVLAPARGYDGNRFKIDLAKRAIVRALGQAAAGEPQQQSDKHLN